MRTSLSLLALLGVFGVASAQNGSLYFSQDGTGRLFQLDTATGVATDIGTTGVTGSTVGLTEDFSGGLFGSTWTQLSSIDPVTGTHTVIGGNLGAEGLASDPTTGLLYWSINGSFGTADPLTGNQIASLADPVTDVEGLAYAKGFIYGSDDEGNLKQYDIANNSWSTIGNVGFQSDDSGLAYDPIGDFFYLVSASDTNLYRVDRLTAAATLVGDTGLGLFDTTGGLAFVAAPVPEPATMAALGLGALALIRRKRKSA